MLLLFRLKTRFTERYKRIGGNSQTAKQPVFFGLHSTSSRARGPHLQRPLGQCTNLSVRVTLGHPDGAKLHQNLDILLHLKTSAKWKNALVLWSEGVVEIVQGQGVRPESSSAHVKPCGSKTQAEIQQCYSTAIPDSRLPRSSRYPSLVILF